MLATIQRDVPVDVDPIAEAARAPDRSKLREVFREFELRDPLRRLEEALGDDDAAAPAPVAEQTIAARVREGTLADVAALGVDGEVARRRARAGAARGRAVRRERDVALRASRPATEVLAGDARRPEELVAALGDRPVIAHDAKALGSSRRNLAHDTLLAAYLLEPARRGFPFREICEERGLARRRRGPGRRRRGARPRRSPAGSASSSPTAA